jgi:hypothetical protein
MKKIHLTALDLDLEVPDIINYHDDGFVEDVSTKRKELFRKYKIKTGVEDNNPLGESTIVKLENEDFDIYTYYSKQAQPPIKAHEETHVALAVLGITKDRKIARQLTSRLEEMSGINCLKSTRHIRDKDFRDEVIAFLAELIYSGQTQNIDNYCTDLVYEEMKEARRIYRQCYLKTTK